MSRSLSLLTPPIEHVLDLMITWTRVHAISAILIESYARHASTSPAKGKTCVGHSPTRKKYRHTACLNRGAQLSINCVTAPLYYQGPTIPVGRPYANPPHATWRPSRASAWPPATRQRHLRLAWATRALPHGLSAASHLEVKTSPRQHLQVKTSPFLRFF